MTVSGDPPGTQWLRMMRQPRPLQWDRMANFNRAMKDLNLSPQEQYLYHHHLNNLWGAGKVWHPDEHSISTVYSMGVEINGKNYTIPSVWDGQILPRDQAVARAKAVGLDKWPTYPTGEEGDARYQAIHPYMDRDLVNMRQAGTSAFQF